MTFFYGSLIFSEEYKFLSGHIIPVDAHTDINTHEAANKTDEITCRQAEPCAKPPPKPTKKCNAEYDS